ncbi:MAG TPA: lipocalin-like domain-containing protein [Casimicrobiaceae bacterium]|nr:lipocalin-like domain-containing protein [Casimicrobiaceae bacterium]
MLRRRFLASPLVLAAMRAFARPAIDTVRYPQVVPRALEFPRDHGSHPDFRTEWWYITGVVRMAEGRAIGVQVTFFRSRPGVAEQSASAFAPRQLLFAHAALADPTWGHLRYDQRAAREFPDVAAASQSDTEVRIDDWSLVRVAEVYHARILAREFSFDLAFRPTQPVLLQGQDGLSRKGPAREQASYYYSVPQLDVSGTVAVNDRRIDVRGRAWLDHEWSSQYLASDARGWDWTGIDFDDGGALMAFRIRKANGESLWAGGSYRDANAGLRVFGPGEVAFVPLRQWRSPRSAIDYPVSFDVHAGEIRVRLEPLFDDQELDARASVGSMYWEGASRARAADGRSGSGYLELTGYDARLRV